MAKATYQYVVEVHRSAARKWEFRVRLAHGKKNVICNSAGQGYENWKDALEIAKNVFGTGYGFKFKVERANGKLEEVRPW